MVLEKQYVLTRIILLHDRSFSVSRQSKIIALAFSMAAEIERDLISQRTKEALRFKKEQGVALGRPNGHCQLDAHPI